MLEYFLRVNLFGFIKQFSRKNRENMRIKKSKYKVETIWEGDKAVSIVSTIDSNKIIGAIGLGEEAGKKAKNNRLCWWKELIEN